MEPCLTMCRMIFGCVLPPAENIAVESSMGPYDEPSLSAMFLVITTVPNCSIFLLRREAVYTLQEFFIHQLTFTSLRYLRCLLHGKVTFKTYLFRWMKRKILSSLSWMGANIIVSERRGAWQSHPLMRQLRCF